MACLGVKNNSLTFESVAKEMCPKQREAGVPQVPFSYLASTCRPAWRLREGSGF